MCRDNRPPIFLLYGIVTPVKVTKSTSARSAADVADESSGFISSREGETKRGGEDGEMEIGE